MMMNEMRSMDHEIKLTDDMTVEGYAVVFDSLSKEMRDANGRRFREKISPKALEGIDLSNVLAVYSHDYKDVLARTDAGNLALIVDDVGLRYHAEFPDTTVARDLYQNIKVGNVRSCSFRWNGTVDSWQIVDGEYIRTIEKIQTLKEITFTPIPAYDATSAETVRSLDDFEAGLKVPDELKQFKQNFEKENILWKLGAE